MIQLYSQHSLVVGRNGQRRSFGFEDVRAALVRSLRDCGSEESWIAEHVLLVIEEQILRMHGRGESIGEAQVDRLVASVLEAAGYRDVARAYGERRGVDPVAELSIALRTWDTSRLEEILAEALPLSEDEVPALAGRVAGALGAMGFVRASDVMIRELGIHFLCGEGREGAGAAGVAVPASGFVLSAGSLTACAGLSGSRWESEGVLRIRPVSGVFPRACVDVHLDCFGSSFGEGPIVELQLLPELRGLCRKLAGVVSAVRERVVGLRPDAACAPAHVVVHGLRGMLERCLVPMGRRAQQACESEVRNCFEREVADVSAFEVILTFR